MTPHRKDAVDAAIQGLVEGGADPNHAESYRILLTLMYDLGYKESRRNIIEEQQKAYISRG